MAQHLIQTLVEWLQEAQHTVVLTGAGMSTESGLPDFRSNQGLWYGRDPQEIASVHAIRHNREDFVDFYRWRIKEVDKYQPHAGHHVLTRWQRQGFVQRIITQNVDGFHHQAASHDVIELHGSLRELYCMDCGHRTDAKRYLQDKGEVCPRCGGFLRPDIVLFGEMLDTQAIEAAFDEARQAELFIVLGSSLQVSPANMLPMEAKDAGAKLAIVNLHDTLLDPQADLLIEGKVGDVLRQTDEWLNKDEA
ncbi:NAD-dependent deacetylase [Caldalkalibacillus uzonensis]|uniref:protein acetyllysine N-acetyltransferase n=1 Tax=Caldalkalibacillus uzonensis TaxID=353224 RepID=A0ABU0CR78_9BACI|nr:NAD-dependent deacylase [Caldalkalibacillus uzonensis]MDQ0338879.1 NAD-dependent deacetylase [Caldalkalibacillus uzonensis]